MRSRGDGTEPRRRSDGRWQANISTPHGRRSVYGKTRDECASRVRLATHARDIGTPPGSKETVAGFASRWLLDCATRVRPNTLRSYSDLVDKWIIPTIGTNPLAKLTPEHIQLVLAAARKKGRSAGTQRHIRTALKQMLALALKWDLVRRNVAALVDPPRAEHHEPRSLSLDTFKAFLKAIAGRDDEALWLLLVATGMRKGEALALHWRSVDLDAANLCVERTLQRIGKKGESRLAELPPKSDASRREVALPASLVTALRTHKAAQGEVRLKAGKRWHGGDYVFTSPIGTPLDPRNVSRFFAALLKTAKLPHIRIHDLRHTWVTLQLTQGTPLHEVSAAAGHASPSITTDIYAHVLREAASRPASTMDALVIAARQSKD